MKKIFYLSIMLIVFLSLTALVPKPVPVMEIDKDTSVWELLKQLGEPEPNHTIKNLPENASVEIGRDLVLKGISKPKVGKSSSLQSKHFVCTSCHNIEQEDPDLTVVDPQARLEYAKQKGIPFLQATTLYGAVNRSSFYNDDYEKKYGDLVIPTRNNLREAIQLCAVECSQGRILESWELESVLAYLWTLEYKLDDLNFSSKEFQSLEAVAKTDADEATKKDLRNLIKGKYLDGIPAHFVEPPANRKKGYDLKGNPDNGQLIYDLSCKHCHERQRYSFFNLDDSKTTFKYLKKHFKKHTRYSTYKVVRFGAESNPGKMAYMPQYTKEKMTDQQVEDLRAYIEMRAK